ncbi:MAG: SCO family protein, partial [Caldilineaceae bacterium]|nr:SCO family protein [Caldilineaceae bacterium]
PTPTRPARPALLILVILLVTSLLVSACGNGYQFNGTPLDPPKELYDITATNWDGSTFRLSGHKGRVLVVFFGYTFCPDVCPTTLAEMVQLYAMLGDNAAKVDIVFISVDPERDTVEKLATYIPAFNPNFYGLRIPAGPELETAKMIFGAFAEQNPTDKTATGDYLVDHTAWVSIVDQDGLLRELFSFESTPAEMLPDIEYLLKKG